MANYPPTSKAIILYDARCNLCNWFVGLVQKKDTQSVFIYVAYQDEASAPYLTKKKSGALPKRKFPFMEKMIWGRPGIWSVGYCVSTVGMNESVIPNYVRSQDEDDRGQLQFEF